VSSRAPIISTSATWPQPPKSQDDLLNWAKDFTRAISDRYGDLARRTNDEIQEGTFAQRPIATGGRRFYRESDTYLLKYDSPLSGGWVDLAVRDSGGEVFNVASARFGAKGDGSTDNATAFANALTAASAVNGRVYIPGSTSAYKIGTGLIIPANVSVFGDGMNSSVIQTTAAIDALTFSSVATANGYHSVRDLYINCNGVGNRGINIKNRWFIELVNLKIAGGLTENVLITSDNSSSVAHVNLIHCFLQGTTPLNLHVAGLFAHQIGLLYSELTGGTAQQVLIDATSGYSVMVNGSSIEGSNGGTGITAQGSTTGSADLDLFIQGSYIEAASTHHIDINPAGNTNSKPRVYVHGTICSGNGTSQSAIRMNAQTAALVVDGLTSIGCTTADIVLGDLSATNALIDIRPGNVLASSTKISSTNPTAAGAVLRRSSASELIGLGGIVPALTWDLSGSQGFRRVSLTLANGQNDNVTLPDGTIFFITGPTGVFSITGFVAPNPATMRRALIVNSTGQVLTMKNNTGSSAGNKLFNPLGADLALGGTTFQFVEVYYDTSGTAWFTTAHS
jgi:hypothetical protein